MTKSELEAIVRQIMDATREHVKAKTAPLLARIDELERLLAAAEERGASLERRASRHAEHLGRLETRVRAVETK